MVMTSSYDLLVIGAGPGGYVAAIRARQLGARVLLVEQEAVGGVCLNHGCIPTKALVAAADLVHRIKQAGEFGIDVPPPRVDYARMLARNAAIIGQLRDGIQHLVTARSIDLRLGRAAFAGPHEAVIERDGPPASADQRGRAGARETVAARHVILATGASPRPLPGLPFDGRRILSYKDLLAQQELPQRLLIIGGGAIGCEFASLLHEFGTAVTLVEQEAQLLPGGDPDIARRLSMSLERRGVRVHVGTTAAQITAGSHGVTAALSSGETVEAAQALVAVGQSPRVEALQLEAAGVRCGRAGIPVDAHLRTNVPHILAIGDVVGEHGLAHVASYEGRQAAENLFGQAAPRDYRVVPNCIFTYPEIASVGLSEAEARAAGTYAVKTSGFHFGGLGKSQVLGETEGLVKLVGDERTGALLGGIIIGHQASSLIHVLTLALQTRAPLRELASVITAHPTLPESISEAAAAFFGEAIHVLARSRR